MSRPSDEGRCDLCGEPMPEGESMFRMHGYSEPCPKPPMPVTTPTHCACVWHGQADGPPFSECHYHATIRADLAAVKAQRDALREGADVVRADLAAAKALLQDALPNCFWDSGVWARIHAFLAGSKT